MKNMFLVVNKEKIYAYIVSIMTIVTIFFMSSLINSDLKETEVTSSNNVENSAVGEAVSTSTPYDASEDVKDSKASDSINENTSENKEFSSTEQKNEETSSSINNEKRDDILSELAEIIECLCIIPPQLKHNTI